VSRFQFFSHFLSVFTIVALSACVGNSPKNAPLNGNRAPLPGTPSDTASSSLNFEGLACPNVSGLNPGLEFNYDLSVLDRVLASPDVSLPERLVEYLSTYTNLGLLFS